MAFGLRWLGNKLNASQAVKDAQEALILGVQAVQAEYVEALKRGNADGKLTPEEAKEAKDLALAKAKTLASAQGLKVMQAWGEDKLSALVELVLNRIKK